jgi:hypothetical protein
VRLYSAYPKERLSFMTEDAQPLVLLIGENLDLGLPQEVQLIFNRKINRKTPGRFRTCILTQDVTPSLHAAGRLRTPSASDRVRAPAWF